MQKRFLCYRRCSGVQLGTLWAPWCLISKSCLTWSPSGACTRAWTRSSPDWERWPTPWGTSEMFWSLVTFTSAPRNLHSDIGHEITGWTRRADLLWQTAGFLLLRWLTTWPDWFRQQNTLLDCTICWERPTSTGLHSHRTRCFLIISHQLTLKGSWITQILILESCSDSNKVHFK